MLSAITPYLTTNFALIAALVIFSAIAFQVSGTADPFASLVQNWPVVGAGLSAAWMGLKYLLKEMRHTAAKQQREYRADVEAQKAFFDKMLVQQQSHNEALLKLVLASTTDNTRNVQLMQEAYNQNTAAAIANLASAITENHATTRTVMNETAHAARNVETQLANIAGLLGVQHNK